MHSLNYSTRLSVKCSQMQTLLHAKHAQERPNLHVGAITCSVVELPSCFDTVIPTAIRWQSRAASAGKYEQPSTGTQIHQRTVIKLSQDTTAEHLVRRLHKQRLSTKAISHCNENQIHSTDSNIWPPPFELSPWHLTWPYWVWEVQSEYL